MQPVQDITVDDRVSRTQFQYTLEDPNADELNSWAPRMLAKLQQLPEVRDVASDQQELGLRAQLVFDRETASRLGITPAFIDQTLYDSYGQRQISTMFTQLNQYHVILEVEPEFRDHPIDLRDLFIRSGVATATSPATNPASCRAGLPSPHAGRSPVGTPRDDIVRIDRGCRNGEFDSVWRRLRLRPRRYSRTAIRRRDRRSFASNRPRRPSRSITRDSFPW